MTRKQERKRRFGAGVLALLAALGCLWAASAGGAALWWLAGVAAALILMHKAMIGPPGVAVLTYHSVSPDPGWLPWSQETAVSPETFAAHCSMIGAPGLLAITSDELVRMRAAGERPRGDEIVLHFDDGYLDNWLYAAPILERHGIPASFFVSLDFVEPGALIRTAPDARDVSGYMNWAEIAAMQKVRGLEIEPHGVDHARIPVSERAIDRLTEANWRKHAWLQWHGTNGPKHDWYRSDAPPAVPIGSPVPESGLALAVRGWVNGRREDVSELEERLREQLTLCQTVFAQRLGMMPRIFCWPENKVGAEGRRIARELGFAATTGGKGRNRADEPVDVISRLHMGDRALGFRWLAAERLHFRAAVRLAQGNHYYYALIAPMNLCRKLVFAWRKRFGKPFA